MQGVPQIIGHRCEQGQLAYVTQATAHLLSGENVCFSTWSTATRCPTTEYGSRAPSGCRVGKGRMVDCTSSGDTRAGLSGRRGGGSKKPEMCGSGGSREGRIHRNYARS